MIDTRHSIPRFGASNQSILDRLKMAPKLGVSPGKCKVIQQDVLSLLNKRDAMAGQPRENKAWIRELVDRIKQHPSDWVRMAVAGILEEETGEYAKKQAIPVLQYIKPRENPESPVGMVLEKFLYRAHEVQSTLSQADKTLAEIAEFRKSPPDFPNELEYGYELENKLYSLLYSSVGKMTPTELADTEWKTKTFLPAMEELLTDKQFSNFMRTHSDLLIKTKTTSPAIRKVYQDKLNSGDIHHFYQYYEVFRVILIGATAGQSIKFAKDTYKDLLKESNSSEKRSVLINAMVSHGHDTGYDLKLKPFFEYAWKKETVDYLKEELRYRAKYLGIVLGDDDVFPKKDDFLTLTSVSNF